MTSIPTISQLYNDVLTDLQTKFSITIPLFGKNFLRALAMVQAARLKLLYLGLAMVQKNIFPDTADPEAAGGSLERFGRVKIGRDPYPATQGEYILAIAVTTNTTLPAGSIFKSADTSLSPGKLFVFDAGGAVSAPSDSIRVRALEAGTGSRLRELDILTLVAPVVGMPGTAYVTDEDIQPIDAETIEEYRYEVLQSFILYPQGGASADYRIWGSQATGVKQIYPYAKSGAPNEIDIFVEATIGASTDGKGTPGGTILTSVAALIETDPATSKGRRPLGVYAVHTLPVIINEIDIVVNGSGSITAGQQTTLTAAITQALNAVRPFIAGCDVLAQKNDIFGVNTVIAAMLAAIPGVVFGAIDMTVTIGMSTSTVSTKTFDNGNIPILNSVTYA